MITRDESGRCAMILRSVWAAPRSMVPSVHSERMGAGERLAQVGQVRVGRLTMNAEGIGRVPEVCRIGAVASGYVRGRVAAAWYRGVWHVPANGTLAPIGYTTCERVAVLARARYYGTF